MPLQERNCLNGLIGVCLLWSVVNDDARVCDSPVMWDVADGCACEHEDGICARHVCDPNFPKGVFPNVAKEWIS